MTHWYQYQEGNKLSDHLQCMLQFDPTTAGTFRWFLPLEVWSYLTVFPQDNHHLDG